MTATTLPPVTTLGRAIDALCARRGWFGGDFAQASTLSASTVSRLRSGERLPTRELVDRMVDGLELNDRLSESERRTLYESAGFLPDWDPFGGAT